MGDRVKGWRDGNERVVFLWWEWSTRCRKAFFLAATVTINRSVLLGFLGSDMRCAGGERRDGWERMSASSLSFSQWNEERGWKNMNVNLKGHNLRGRASIFIHTQIIGCCYLHLLIVINNDGHPPLVCTFPQVQWWTYVRRACLSHDLITWGGGLSLNEAPQ